MKETIFYILRIFFVSIIAFILQGSVVNRMWPGGSSPDLLFVMVLLLVLDRGPVIAVVTGFLLGFLQDLGNASFLGMNALANSTVAYAVSRLGRDYLPDSAMFRISLFFVAYLAKSIIILNIAESFSPIRVILFFFRYSILSALYTAFIAIFVWKLLEFLSERVVRPGGGY
ncbi:rod shape-determining protein MreD [bacterium]|nr:rod shape-determining protein MreD [bacterium]